MDSKRTNESLPLKKFKGKQALNSAHTPADTKQLYISVLLIKFAGDAILDDLFGFPAGGANNLEALPPSVHEAPADLELRVS